MSKVVKELLEDIGDQFTIVSNNSPFFNIIVVGEITPQDLEELDVITLHLSWYDEEGSPDYKKHTVDFLRGKGYVVFDTHKLHIIKTRPRNPAGVSKPSRGKL